MELDRGSVSEEKSVDYSDSSGEDECVDVNNSSGEDECTDDTDSSVEDQFEGLTVVQLKEHCRRRNIRYGGTKKVLLGRLREYERTKDDDDESVGEEDDGDEAVKRMMAMSQWVKVVSVGVRNRLRMESHDGNFLVYLVLL